MYNYTEDVGVGSILVVVEAEWSKFSTQSLVPLAEMGPRLTHHITKL